MSPLRASRAGSGFLSRSSTSRGGSGFVATTKQGSADTIDLEQMKAGYYTIPAVNSTQIVPIGQEIDFWQPHGRGG